MVFRSAIVSACVAAIVATTPLPLATAAPVALPPTTGGFDYQLGGAADTPGLAVVARDSTAAPMPGAYNVCYVNGYQTQPGSGQEWLARHPDAVLRGDSGEPLVDPDWPDEYLLDPSTPEQRTAILQMLGPSINLCASSGFDAVEIDNLDTFTRTPAIDRAGALELARAFVELAHGNGLAIGQKNAAEITDIGRGDIGFDFAVAEECAAYDECDAYTRAYGSHVLQIEYADNLPRPFASVCASERAPLTILRDRGLTAPGTPGHVYEQCR
ncbi:endo alpha-1,4 polygalactosaminidase [Mycobacterium sp. 236(2023)]|uniref:endo alpha-1,4 polygalactosaminidase n=1 Tax=Mycobacterium sp. 236(2023) TaxID=3038163 RepID=UPI0024151CB0|nr:endo alpha-1,4 polygalactosaminidase [Mycobacterium sp. 236(2023)]MDG4666179.1 endo alpha-1,4 polygalactosaminidase [Mycobacterium sp. 236(2023)]